MMQLNMEIDVGQITTHAKDVRPGSMNEIFHASLQIIRRI